MSYTQRVLLALATSALFALPASAATVPVFDWVNVYTGAISPVSIIFGSGQNSEDGSIYIGSHFSGTPDFDPGEGTDLISSTGGSRDPFISKLSSDGEYQWTKTWGGTQDDYLTVLDVGVSGVFGGGYFRSAIDFDPGVGTSWATSTGGLDNFIVKFDSDGNFQWVRTWGKTANDDALVTAISDTSDNLYIGSSFTGTIDFDPGVGTAYATSSGSFDSVILKFDSDGNFQWVRRWGGSGQDGVAKSHLGEDGSVYIPGFFNTTVDFDPGAGTENKTSVGSVDAFLLKLDSDGLFEWAQTWGGTGSDFGSRATSDVDRNVYVSGDFAGAVDFDPGVGTSWATSTGSSDIFISKFSSDGTWQWTKTWGGTGSDSNGHVVVVGDTVFVVGYFSSTVDFDPSGDSNSIASRGGLDVFISAFDTSGNYLYTQTFGGSSNDTNNNITDGIGIDSNKLLFDGFFQSATVDFDPSSAVASRSSDGSDMFFISFDLIEPSATVTTDDLTLREEASAADSITYTIVLADAPPSRDVIVTISPDADLSVSTTSILFSTTTWNTPQTITVTAVDDTDEEATHEGVITHTVTSDDGAFDGLSISSVTITIADDDSRSSGGGSSGGGGSRSSGISNAVQTITDQDPAPQPADPAVENNAELIAELQVKITELKQQLIQLLTQKIKELQAQLAAMQ